MNGDIPVHTKVVNHLSYICEHVCSSVYDDKANSLTYVVVPIVGDFERNSVLCSCARIFLYLDTLCLDIKV
jgi:hypothetical protein